MSICLVEECTREVYVKGMCIPHYTRMRRHGSPTGGASSRASQVEVCGVESCTSAGYAKGYCQIHYSRYKNYGNAEEPARYSTAKTLAEKFAEGAPKGLDDDVCWEWTKGCGGAGYGDVHYASKKLRAHRVAYELANGAKIPDDLVVRHTCDNPPCVNPSHLILGTHADNVADMLDRGRNVITQGRLHGRAKLTEAEVLRIRKLYVEGMSSGALAKEFGVSCRSVYGIVRRETWTHI